MEILLVGLALPARFRFSKPMSGRDFVRFCAANSDLRIEQEPNGEVLVMASAGSEGGSYELRVGTQLMVWALREGHGKAFGPNSGFTLPDGSVRMPDAAWINFVRWNTLSTRQQKANAPMCPEFIIEIRSESDRLPPLRAKMEMWMANGAEVAWLIDPRNGTVTIYRRGEPPHELNHPSSVQGTGAVDGFQLILD